MLNFYSEISIIRRHKKCDPRVHVWKLQEEQTCEESMVGDKLEEEEWKHLDLNELWHKMKKIIMETAQHICGMSKGPCRHKEIYGGGMRRLLKQ